LGPNFIPVGDNGSPKDGKEVDATKILSSFK
jgi:hypothetical protein